MVWESEWLTTPKEVESRWRMYCISIFLAGAERKREIYDTARAGRVSELANQQESQEQQHTDVKRREAEERKIYICM